MDWRDIPVGIIQNDELLNALMAIWKTRYDLMNKFPQNEVATIYSQGFEEGLDAIAQVAGIETFFEARKEAYKTKLEHKQITKAKLISASIHHNQS